MSEMTSEIGTITIPSGFILRPAQPGDAQGIVDLICAADLFYDGESDFTLEDLLNGWEDPDFVLDQDAWVVIEQNSGRVVGYEELSNRFQHARLDGDGYVHPDTRGLGIGTALLRRMEQRAAEHIPLAPPELQVSLRNGVTLRDPASLELHTNEGYRPLRYFWGMRIDQQAPPPQPEWPDELELRLFLPGEQAYAVYEALEDAFSDHWGFIPEDYASWRRRHVDAEDFDPSLVFVCWSGEEIAGIAFCRRKPDFGWVRHLGVRRAWRRRGLGLALLHHAFGAFYRRGIPSVGLGVDSQNPTGATRLYERAGMYIKNQYAAYEKILRPGILPGEDE